jgi:hypothetical protein
MGISLWRDGTMMGPWLRWLITQRPRMVFLDGGWYRSKKIIVIWVGFVMPITPWLCFDTKR